MTNISIITPLHHAGVKFISETYKTLQAQTLTDWQWLILENNGGITPAEIKKDPRVIIYKKNINGVGALKGKLCNLATTKYIVELDADDLLIPTALEKVFNAFEAGADFVYSDFVEFNDKTWKPNVYSSYYGWSTYPYNYEGHDLTAMRAPEVNPQNLRYVDFTPNHIRAFTKASYTKVGGHNINKPVADDHDLVVRLYLAGMKFTHIPEPLYIYRVHKNNTVITKNSLIREETNKVYNENIWALGEKFANDNNLLKIDLCGGIDCPINYHALDKIINPGISGTACDLNNQWPLKDNCVGILRANDSLEHLKDSIHTMNEAYRVLAPGGFFMIMVPSTNGKGAWCDPTHKSFFNDLSFRYYTNKQFARYIPEFKGKFQVGRVIEWYPSEWHKQNNVPYVEAELFALKDGFKPMGEVSW
jgi:glycosyltransferase involved in cell wall biosynthesis